MQEKRHRPEKVHGIAMVICEKVITEAATDNKTLVSTFNSIRAEAFPCTQAAMAVYVALTNGNGKKRIVLRLKKGNDEIIQMGGTVIFEHPNRVIELIFDFRNAVFPEPGLYTFEVLADNRYVMESRINAVSIPPETGDELHPGFTTEPIGELNN